MQNNKSVSRRSSVKMAEDKKGRGTNFGAEDSQLLAQVMGATSKFNKHMTNHQLYKHRFESGITSQTKKAMWVAVAEEFNSSAIVHRTSEKLEKKWHNLTAKHRLIYSDVQREMALTGGGRCSKTAGLLTNQVMDVIGRTTDAINGAETTILDSSYMALKSVSSRERDVNLNALNSGDYDMSDLVAEDSLLPYTPAGRSTCTFTTTTRASTSSTQETSDSDLESMTLDQLQKRKLILQIKYYEKKLKV